MRPRLLHVVAADLEAQVGRAVADGQLAEVRLQAEAAEDELVAEGHPELRVGDQQPHLPHGLGQEQRVVLTVRGVVEAVGAGKLRLSGEGVGSVRAPVGQEYLGDCQPVHQMTGNRLLRRFPHRRTVHHGVCCSQYRHDVPL